MIDHSSRAHAELSASGSVKWFHCPGSHTAEKGFPAVSSIYADEGTAAHELAALCFEQGINPHDHPGVDPAMAGYVSEYIQYVQSFWSISLIAYVEVRLDFSNVVPNGFGTADYVLLVIDDEGVCHLFDLKYGKGVKVFAFENTQLMLYAIGVDNEFGFLTPFKRFVLHICQPRLQHYDSWELSHDELMEFAEEAREKAHLALQTNAPRIAGEKQCRFCKAKSSCPEALRYAEAMLGAQFEDLTLPQNLDDSAQKRILDGAAYVREFLKSVEDDVFQRLESGESFPGYKLVRGRSNRKWTDEAEAALKDILQNEAYKKTLITITEAEKLLSKEVVNNLTFKPLGVLTLAPEHDKRPAEQIEKIENMFDDL